MTLRPRCDGPWVVSRRDVSPHGALRVRSLESWFSIVDARTTQGRGCLGVEGGGRSIGVSALFFALFLFFFGGHVVRFCGTLPPSCRFWRKGRSGGRAGSGEREREGELDDAGPLEQDLIRLILRHRALAGAWRAQSASLSGAPDWIRCGPRRVFTQWGPRTAHLPCTGDAASNNQILQFSFRFPSFVVVSPTEHAWSQAPITAWSRPILAPASQQTPGCPLESWRPASGGDTSWPPGRRRRPRPPQTPSSAAPPDGPR